MKLILPYTWRQALSSNFSADRVKTHGNRYRKNEKHCLCLQENFTELQTLKTWCDEMRVRAYTMGGLFNNRQGDINYIGLVLNFTHDDDLMMFKLSFS